MAAHDASMARRLARVGMGSLLPVQGLAVLNHVISADALGAAFDSPEWVQRITDMH